MKTPFETIQSIDEQLFNSVKKSKGPKQFNKHCPKCDNIGKVYPENGKLIFHCYSCGYIAHWDKVAKELKEKNVMSINNPFGGSVELYDIEKEKELLN
jgi:hypothetical protein